MSENSHIDLLIVDSSPSASELISRKLLDAGHTVQVLRTDNETEIQNTIQYKPLNLIISRAADNLPSIGSLRQQLDSAHKDIALLAITDDVTTRSSGELLRAGADNLCCLNDPEHFLLNIRTELRHLDLRRQAHSLEIRLQETEARNRSLLDISGDGIAYIHEGVHIFANPTYLELFGYSSQEELASITLINLVAPDDRDELKRFLRDNMKQGKPLEPIALTGLHSDGSSIPLRLSCISTQIDEEPCLQIVIQSSMPSQPLPHQLEDISAYDVYTGLYNRKSFSQRLDEVCADPSLSGGAVLYILLTDYRSISERLGLEAIDQITVDLANLLRTLVSKNDVIARFSDAVFTIYSSKASRKSALQLGERICVAIKDHVSHAAQKLITTSSVTGICLIQDLHQSAYQILAHADRACEQARKMGPNNVQVYTPRSTKTDAEKHEDHLVDLIRDAISGERLNLLFQPIASFQNNTEERYRIELEILDKNQDPLDMNIIAPVAERRGLLFALDKWTIMRGLDNLTARYRQGKTPPALFVPVSGNSLKQNSNFFSWLVQRLKDTGLSADFLVIEVTEEQVEQYFKQSKDLRGQLKQLKCGFALSQFGGKSNSERILQHLKPDYIKIDSALIDKLSNARDTATREAMTALTQQAQEMAAKVVAEGISSAPQMASIWQYGVTLVQGNMVQEPRKEMDFDFKMFAG